MHGQGGTVDHRHRVRVDAQESSHIASRVHHRILIYAVRSHSVLLLGRLTSWMLPSHWPAAWHVVVVLEVVAGSVTLTLSPESVMLGAHGLSSVVGHECSSSGVASAGYA